MRTSKVLIQKVHKARSLVILTIVFLVILVLTDVYLLVQVIMNKIPYILGISLLAIITATVIGSYLYAPMSIALSDDALILYRGIGKKKFNYSDIATIDTYISDGTVVRICGIGGVFGFIGRYYTKKIGHYFSYVGDYSQAFYLRLKNGKKYLFSCEDRDLIVFLVKKKIA